MGWMNQTTTRTTEAVIRSELAQCWTLKVAFYREIGSAAYVALERVDGCKVEALVVAFERHGTSLSLKYLSEECGPCYYDAPAELLEMLTPTETGYAPAWRARCRETIAARQAGRPPRQSVFATA